jgi:hypothetical protein
MIITGAEVILRVGAGVGILGVIISQEATMVTIVTATAAVKITITVGWGEDVVEATVKAETAVKTAEEAAGKVAVAVTVIVGVNANTTVGKVGVIATIIAGTVLGAANHSKS